MVLVESLFEVSAVMPRVMGEPMVSRALVYRDLPAIFGAYYLQMLRPVMDQTADSHRNDREAHTLCLALDGVIRGEPLRAIMILLGRLKALKSLLVPGTLGWQEAQLHELVASRGSGLLTATDRENATRDLLDQRRMEDFRGRGGPPGNRGAAPPAPRPGGDRGGGGRGGQR